MKRQWVAAELEVLKCFTVQVYTAFPFQCNENPSPNLFLLLDVSNISLNSTPGSFRCFRQSYFQDIKSM